MDKYYCNLGAFEIKQVGSFEDKPAFVPFPVFAALLV
jgi:hypothetical protein